MAYEIQPGSSLFTVGSGPAGGPGPSAYALWLTAGNSGSLDDYLASLNGKDGQDGPAGAAGQNAYQVWLAAGNTGSVSDYIASLKGQKGDQGVGTTIKGAVANYAALPTTGMSMGDVYLMQVAGTDPQGRAYQAGDGYVYKGGTPPWQYVGPIRGPVGAKGEKGEDGKTVFRVAASDIASNTYVVDQPNGACAIADPTNAAHRGKLLGLVVSGVASGSVATIQSIGPIPNVAGTFAPGDSLYIGDGTTGRLGSIVNVPPSAGWRQNVGTATTSSLINALLGEARLINTGSALVLSSGGFANVSDLGRAFVEATPSAVIAALLSILDVLPPLPDDPANYPVGGGLFRNGDANGWTLTRTLPKV